MPPLNLATLTVQIAVFAWGALTTLITVASAVRVLVLPRSAYDRVASATFRLTRAVFDLAIGRADTYEQRDAIMALYAPVSLLALPVVWLTLVLAGYTAMFWATGLRPWTDALVLSGSSLLTLGLASSEQIGHSLLSFSEAAIGLSLLALLIAYLPTIYAAFSRREAAVTLLEVRAGSPPSAVQMIERYTRIQGLHRMTELWQSWEVWFGELEETHTSLAALPFFRSPQPQRSWITAAGAVLDGAALVNSTLDLPRDPQQDLCIRAGYLALRSIADFFGISYNPTPRPDDPISVLRSEYDAVYDRLARAGIPVKPDRDAAWRSFAGWRVNYDTVLVSLAVLVMAPPAPWISDRGPVRRPKLRKLRVG
ncbi:MAG TPA: hypothetical protein VFZ25_15995 [Chloroflexota bacterium]|nr:hypothetical protein [Chloroflexota bacterium]